MILSCVLIDPFLQSLDIPHLSFKASTHSPFSTSPQTICWLATLLTVGFVILRTQAQDSPLLVGALINDSLELREYCSTDSEADLLGKALRNLRNLALRRKPAFLPMVIKLTCLVVAASHHISQCRENERGPISTDCRTSKT